ncbi:ABC transporter ATP-binding protein [Deinococcus metallilatus]|uniref:ABC transporter ATP-binding protein n=1 Tax=Deinococcus metallilatus TaxID=1211322 RepID=A0AAJ5F9G6_9DEIO|nr:ABC transporter ATP-binding protein [Deinococcus metallilatus]MBB5294974.1 branched-chain amino acid transport system ATP-binding protein [Deinococcus metallilatus]QBY09333.1 ABC transporter ATP-binding protein [Deinococcus metallilatus]RXJ09338.1 ABC transporter ATP-binding protein [Deinococcus metallilatus]TLK28860.1 ABC transporter ATP-binding protein [Deinococcus metallilatus]GMA16906.1 ABC transporter ATP-binding protein [Deinococcus metallilatus]
MTTPEFPAVTPFPGQPVHAPQGPPLLTAEGITVRFGGVTAVKDISLAVRPGEILGLIGPNGAGKTTLFNALTGFARPSAGRVTFDGRDVTQVPPQARARLGMARTFQVERPFENLSVLENVLVASFLHHRGRVAEDQAYAVLERVGLADRAAQPAAELNLARRRRLELAKALALEPRLLFLDESIAGLNPPAQQEMVALIRSLVQSGLGVVMVEHIMHVIMSLSDHVICMAFGELLAEGEPQAVAAHPDVIRAYLGDDHD